MVDIDFFGYWSSPQRFGNQFKVSKREDVVELLKIWNGAMNCGISVCTFKGEVPYLIYLPFDFDSDSLEKSWQDAMKLYNWIVDDGYDVSIQYSGFRGFHVLISVVPKYYSRGQVKAIQKYYKNMLNLKTCDPQIFGDIRRLIRIPGSLHAGKFKKVKKKGWQRIDGGGYAMSMKHTDGELLDIDEIFDDTYPDYEFENINGNCSYTIPLHPLPCVDTNMDNKEPGHLIRYSYVTYHLKTGKTPEEIYSMLEERHSEGKKYEWDDWSKGYTLTQIMHIASNDNYNPLSCKSLKSMGYCIGTECPYYYQNQDWKIKKLKDIRNERRKDIHI